MQAQTPTMDRYHHCAGQLPLNTIEIESNGCRKTIGWWSYWKTIVTISSFDQRLATIENHWKSIEYNCTETKTIDHSIVLRKWPSLRSRCSKQYFIQRVTNFHVKVLYIYIIYNAHLGLFWALVLVPGKGIPDWTDAHKHKLGRTTLLQWLASF